MDIKKWMRWQDWVAVAAGLYAALATLWTTARGASVALLLILGVLLIIAGLWSLAMPGLQAAQWTVAVIGALLFISPWVGAYATEAGPAWTSWICGAVGIITGLWSLQPTVRARRQTRTAH